MALLCLQKTGTGSKSSVPDAKTLGSQVACTGSKLPFPAGEREGFIQESSLEASGHQMEGQEKKGKLSAFSLVRALLPCEGNRLEPKHLTEISSYILT